MKFGSEVFFFQTKQGSVHKLRGEQTPMDEKKQANKGQNIRKIAPGGRQMMKTCQTRTTYSILTSLTGSEA